MPKHTLFSANILCLTVHQFCGQLQNFRCQPFALLLGDAYVQWVRQSDSHKLAGKNRNIIGAVAVVLAAAIMGITHFSVGGFPELNLLFI